MNWLLDIVPGGERKFVRRRKHPQWISPMLAKLADHAFSDNDWIFERKLDGERALAFRDGKRLRLLSRNRKDISASYPEIISSLGRQASNDFIFDGEIVAFKGSVTSFARLQQRMHLRSEQQIKASGIAVYFYLFDILHLDGFDTTALPLRTRKNLLQRIARFDRRLRFTTHRNGVGEQFYRQACKKNWEGVIAKRADSRYQHERSSDWLKCKCVSGQELVIGGFTEPHGSREGFGALLVGYYDDGDLRYAGKVGTGFDDETLASLRQRLKDTSQKKSPFADDVHEREATWVRPNMVGDFAFTAWTKRGRLRHPRYIGLRRDKSPHQVKREHPGG